MSTAASQKGTIMEVSDADRRKEWSTSQSGMTQTVGTDADTIGVPRSVLAAACYIIRNSEHAESETAKAMRKYALSTQAAELDALRDKHAKQMYINARIQEKQSAEIETLRVEAERLKMAIEAQMQEKHKEKAEAKLWFTKAQEWKAENVQLRDRVAGLEEGIAWYGEQARLARLIHSEGMEVSEQILEQFVAPVDQEKVRALLGQALSAQSAELEALRGEVERWKK